MKNAKFYLRKKSLLARKKNYAKIKKFDFNLIFKLIKKHFHNKRIIIAGYYPSYYEVDILNFLEQASKKKFRIALPVIRSANSMIFRSWFFKDPLYVSNFGTLEPKNLKQKVIPDLIIVPLVAFDRQLNRIGYGKGYYDRCLRKIVKNKNKIVSVGIAYSFQQCSKVPVNKNDFKLDYIFTEREIISSN